MRCVERSNVRELEARTRQLAIDVVRLSRSCVHDPSLWPLLNQLVRAAGSVSANHLAVAGSRSGREFLAKLCIVCEEAAETVHWLAILLELCPDASFATEAERLRREAELLRNYFSRARATTRRNLGNT